MIEEIIGKCVKCGTTDLANAEDPEDNMDGILINGEMLCSRCFFKEADSSEDPHAVRVTPDAETGRFNAVCSHGVVTSGKTKEQARTNIEGVCSMWLRFKDAPVEDYLKYQGLM